MANVSFARYKMQFSNVICSYVDNGMAVSFHALEIGKV